MTSPMFSVLLPSKDRLELLLCAIESVRRQPFGDFEIVVSDNASSLPMRMR
jgi:glycosyltransferase involved in cell wall biosynthesis